MAKVNGGLAAFFKSKVQNKNTTLRVADETASLTIKAEGAPDTFSENGVVTFLASKAEVKVGQRLALESGAVVSSSGTAGGLITSEAVKAVFNGDKPTV